MHLICPVVAFPFSQDPWSVSHAASCLWCPLSCCSRPTSDFTQWLPISGFIPFGLFIPQILGCPPQSQSLGELEDLPLSCGDRKPRLNAYTHPKPSTWKSTHVVGGRICIYSSKKNQTNRQVRQAFPFRKTMTLWKAGRTSTHRQHIRRQAVSLGPVVNMGFKQILQSEV